MPLIGLIIVFPYLLITCGVFLAYFAKRNRFVGIVGICLVCFPAFLITVGWLNSPTKPSKSGIIGHYVIDRSRYPGKQADWQHATYSLDITETEIILHDARTTTVWKSPITWLDGESYKWIFGDYSKRHHMLTVGPAIYRQPFSYYYVFNSPLYGDVFFIKE